MIISKFEKQRGVTLIELMVTIGVVAVIMMIAVPSFQNYTANQKVRSTTSSLLDALNFARSEAVKRNTTVRVDYDGTDWLNGWTVVIVDDGTQLMSYEAGSGVAIDPAPANDIVYLGNGRVSTGAATFTISEDPDIAAIQSRCLRVTPSGKPSISKGAC